MSEWIMDISQYEESLELTKEFGSARNVPTLIALSADLTTMFGIKPEVMLVRCQDCMHFTGGQPSGAVVGGRMPDWCSLTDYPTHGDGFCHRGIRRGK